MGTEELDPIDHQIIELLSQNARRTMADIGEQVSLSASAVTRRIERLERTGVIAGYTVVVDHRKAGRPIQAFTEVRFAGTADLQEIKETAMQLAEVPGRLHHRRRPRHAGVAPGARRGASRPCHRAVAPPRPRHRHQDAHRARHVVAPSGPRGERPAGQAVVRKGATSYRTALDGRRARCRRARRCELQLVAVQLRRTDNDHAFDNIDHERSRGEVVQGHPDRGGSQPDHNLVPLGRKLSRRWSTNGNTYRLQLYKSKALGPALPSPSPQGTSYLSCAAANFCAPHPVRTRSLRTTVPPGSPRPWCLGLRASPPSTAPGLPSA